MMKAQVIMEIQVTEEVIMEDVVAMAMAEEATGFSFTLSRELIKMTIF
jgi:hypothetical protein